MAKIAFVATVYRHLEAFHLPFMNMLQEQGYEVHAYAAPDAGRNGVAREQVICHDISFCRNPYHIKNSAALLALAKSFAREQFQMVHAHTPVAGILGRIAARWNKVPCVMYTAHGFHFFQGAPLVNWLVYYPLERWLARWTDRLITVSVRKKNRFRDGAVFLLLTETGFQLGLLVLAAFWYWADLKTPVIVWVLYYLAVSLTKAFYKLWLNRGHF